MESQIIQCKYIGRLAIRVTSEALNYTVIHGEVSRFTSARPVDRNQNHPTNINEHLKIRK